MGVGVVLNVRERFRRRPVGVVDRNYQNPVYTTTTLGSTHSLDSYGNRSFTEPDEQESNYQDVPQQTPTNYQDAEYVDNNKDYIEIEEGYSDEDV